MRFSATLAGTVGMLVAVMGAGVAAIVAARRWLRPEPRGHSRAADKLGDKLGRIGVFGAGGRGGPAGGVGAVGSLGHGDWETTLATYKNLRDEGVLSEEEFRKIRTLVEPRPRIGTPELRPRHWPPVDPEGPAQARD